MTEYYLSFTNGNTTLNADGGFLYEVSDLSFGATYGPSGTAAFAPLSFTTRSSALTVQLDAMLAGGTAFTQVNLYGYDTSASGGAPVQVVHDVFKLAYVKSDAVDAGSGEHALALAYGALVESATPQNLDGSSGTPVPPRGWDIVRNVPDNSLTTSETGATVTLPATVDPRTNAATTSSGGLHFYVRFTDLFGDSLGGGDGWIALDSASFGLDKSLTIGPTTTIGGITFDPLTLAFRPGTLEPTLLAYLASGTALGQLEIAAYAPGPSGTSTLLDDYRLDGVTLAASTHAVTDDSPTQTYSVNYKQELIQHVSTAANGSTSTTTSGFDTVNNVALTDAFSSVAAPATEAALQAKLATVATGEGSSTRYYLSFTNYSNVTLSLDSGFLYEVSDLSFGGTYTAATGAFAFNPLTFTTPSSNLTVQLDRMLASGTPFAQVNLYGIDTSAGGVPVQVVHDVFKLVGLKNDAIDAATGEHAITLAYGVLVESATPQNPDGSSGTPVSPLGWNIVKNTGDDNLTTDDRGATVTLPATVDPRTDAAAAGSGGLHLYARFTDYQGNVLGGGGGWIALDSASFEFDQTLNIGQQATGVGAGHVKFDPLTISFLPGTVEPTLLNKLALGIPFEQVEIAAYAPDPSGTSRLLDDDRFNLVGLAASTHAVTDDSLAQSYTLDYGQEVLQRSTTTLTSVAGGTPTVTTTTSTNGWDAVKNVSLTDALLPVAADPTENAIKAKLAPIATGEGSSTRYYLSFTDYTNATQSSDGGFLYEVSNLSFGATQTLNIGPQASGLGAGHAAFVPLTFTTLSSNLTLLLDSKLASGTPFAQVNLYGFDTSPGGSPVQVVHDVFKLVGAQSDAVDVSTGEHAIALAYGAVVESATPQNADGSSGTPVPPQGFDIVKNKTDNDPTTNNTGGTVILPATIDPRNNAVATGSGGALDLYARFTDVAGNPLGGGDGWIALDSASFGLDQKLNIGPNATGLGAGHVTFDPLTLAFRPGTLEPTLLAYLASGTALGQLEIAAYAQGPSGTSTRVDDYRLDSVTLAASTHAVTDDTPTQTYTVHYGQEVVQHVSTAANGSTSTTTSGWDAVRNVALTDASSPVAAPATEAAAQAKLVAIMTGEGPPPAPSLVLTGVSTSKAGQPIPTLSGVAQPGAVVDLYDGTTVIAVAHGAATTGAFSFGPLLPFGTGDHLLTVTATNPDGLHSAASKARVDLSVGPTPGQTDAFAVTTYGSDDSELKQSLYYATGIPLSQATFGIVGQTYTGSVYGFDRAGTLTSARYNGVSGQAYQAFETDYSGGAVVGTRFFYLGISGKAYTTETLSVNAANQQTAVAFGGLGAAPYASYEYDYANGLFAGSTFTYTNLPAGAGYTSYTTAYDFASTYQGAKFFYAVSGQAYTGQELDTTATGAVSRELLTGFTGQPYQTLELDYTGGVYTSYKTFATGITGQSYTGLETDVTAAGQLTKVVYSGLKSTPYTTLEQDYTGGTRSSSTFTFNAPAGQSYSSYSVTQNAAGAQISETVNNTDGSHTILGSAPNLIFESIGNDTITGGGSGETFAFHTVFGHDTLTDFYQHASGAGHDTLDLSTADFTSFAALSSAAQTVSGGVMFTGKSGSSITLLGVDKTTLAGLGADFKFHA